MFRLASLFVDVEAKTTKFDGTLSGLKGKVTSAGVAIGTAFGNLATQAVNLIGQGVSAAFDRTIVSAMDLGETLSKVGVVFGPAAKEVTDQVDDMARRFGLAKQPMLDAAAMFGLMGKGAGMSKDAAAEFSNSLVKLAADASSFYNVPMDQALEKIRAGLSGEAEPLRAFGVFLSDDAMKAQALAMGLIKAGEEMNDQQKIMARSALIQKGLADATGDLARTEDSASNQTRKFWGSLGNLAAEVGQVFLPAFQEGVNQFNAFVGAIQSGFGGARETLEGWAAGVQGAFETVGVILRNAGSVWAMAQISVEQFVANALAHVDAFMQNAGLVGEWFGNNWVNMFNDAGNAILAIFTNLGKNIAAAWQAAMEFIRTGKFEPDFTSLLDGFKATTAQLPEFVQPQLVDFSDRITAEMDKIAENEGRLIEQKAEAARQKQQAATGGDQAAAAAPSKKEFKSQSLDAADFARNLSRANLGDDTKKIQQDQLAALKGIEENTKKAAAAGAGGAALAAVFS